MKIILNLYSSFPEAKTAFDKYVQQNSNEVTCASFRDLSLRTFGSYIKFSYYKNNLCSGQQDGICGQYSEINFYVDLPEQVKNHYLSRIRLANT
jgi:hypothetical protein